MRIAQRIAPSLVLSLALSLHAQQKPNPLAPYIKEDAPVLILNHVRIIDGTGAAPQQDMRIELSHGRITAISAASADATISAGAKVLDLTGKTIIPGLVGMHEHLFYPLPDRPAGGLALYGEMADSAPRLYLAGGVTTARTGGSLEPYTDLELKRAIDAGRTPGPKLDVTGPYLEGPGTFAIQMHELADAADAARTVDYWAAEGVTSFKAYNFLTAAELKAAIDRAHAHHLKITGHLCSIGFRQAADLGIDNLEHGIVVDTEFYPQKRPDECPNAGAVMADMEKNLNIDSPQVHAMIDDLVAHHVAVTSTLAIFETFAPGRPPLAREAAALKELTPDAERDYLLTRTAVAERSGREKMLQIEMKFEREFAAAGGLLMAGCDPTGYGGVLPGFGDQRNLELLVEAGFTPLDAIRIATLNGAKFLGRDADIGSVAAGKSADLVVLGGDPTQNIDNVEKVELVFKNGVGYDPAALIASAKTVGLR
jgi:imidazolonepropionase-like amidohydrolase